MISPDSPCPCRKGETSPLTYNACCQPYHQDLTHPATAESLMRSRFSAFFAKNAEYLITTHHPSQREKNERQALEKAFSGTHWLFLEVKSTEMGKVNDKEGWVTFVAHYESAGKRDTLHERSKFIKEGNRWYYLEGDFLSNKKANIGRNDPCWCGSGIKFKKCHG